MGLAGQTKYRKTRYSCVHLIHAYSCVVQPMCMNKNYIILANAITVNRSKLRIAHALAVYHVVTHELRTL